jgi:hypothetical protein
MSTNKLPNFIKLYRVLLEFQLWVWNLVIKVSSVLQLLVRTYTNSRRNSVGKCGNLFSSGQVNAVVTSALICLTCCPLQRTRSLAMAVPVRTATSGTPTRRSATSFSTVWKACRTSCPALPDSYTTTAAVRAPGRRRAGGRTASTAREVGAVTATNSCTTHTPSVLTTKYI